MVRRSLIAAALFAVAAPLSAQSTTALSEPVDWDWVSHRPDGNAPLGIFGGQTLGSGEMEITYRYTQMNSRGVWSGSDSLPVTSTLLTYNDAPLNQSDIRHRVQVARGISDNLTVLARAEFVLLERETFANNAIVRTSAEALGDVEVGVLYRVYASGPYRMHVQGGAIIPTGASTTYADTTMAQSGTVIALPFDMRPGGGTFGAVLGMTAGLQNEVASLGAQFRLRTNFGTNGAGTTGYRLGDTYEANGWAAYQLNQSFSVSAGLRWQTWDHIEGSDDRLAEFGDPQNRGAVLAGQLVTMPLGLNFLMPAGRFEGHRLSLEAVYAMHHDYEGPQLGLDWGMNFGWTLAF